jgi:hypothetical protein
MTPNHENHTMSCGERHRLHDRRNHQSSVGEVAHVAEHRAGDPPVRRRGPEIVIAAVAVALVLAACGTPPATRVSRDDGPPSFATLGSGGDARFAAGDYAAALDLHRDARTESLARQ